MVFFCGGFHALSDQTAESSKESRINITNLKLLEDVNKSNNIFRKWRNHYGSNSKYGYGSFGHGSIVLHAIWGNEYYSKNNNTITVHIRHLREKLNDSAENPKYIRTVYGVGYRIEKK